MTQRNPLSQTTQWSKEDAPVYETCFGVVSLFFAMTAGLIVDGARGAICAALVWTSITSAAVAVILWVRRLA